jgi:3-hydroxy-9,10-secoandrosta-1,3,5(10)-triene-9,17-dione monooxygenase reductase component
MTDSTAVAAHHEIPEGMSPDARESWPSRELIDSWLGDSWDFELRPGEHVAVDSEEAAEQARAFRDVLGRYASAVTVVTTMSDGVPVGMTCQSFVSVSLDPPLVAFLPTRKSRAFAAIQRAGTFCVNFLAADQADVSGQMAGSRGDDKFAGLSWKPAPATGSPVLEGGVGHVDCTVHAVHEAGDHYIVVGRVQHLAAGEAEQPLLYYRGGYRSTQA